MRTRTVKKAGDSATGTRGRPPIEIDLEQLKQLCALQCTDEEIASVLGISTDTLGRRKADPEFLAVMMEGKATGKMSLRRIQWNLAKTNPAMAIFLGKNYLGQRDKPEEDEDDESNQPLPWND